MPVLTLDQIESLCADALKRAGASDEQATIVAEEIMADKIIIRRIIILHVSYFIINVSK